MVFFQTKTQKQIYEAYGEVLQLDATYRTTNTLMPLFDFVIDDSNGKSVVVGYCFTTNEKIDAISTMLELFKEANPSWVKTKVIVIDKDFAEINAVRESFPDAKICLCLFHMIKSINAKLVGMPPERKEEILILVKKLVRASVEEEVASYLRKLEEASEPFFKYFVENWMVIKEKWCSAYQKGLMTLMNSTTNRVESNHTHLKDHLSPSITLTEAVKILLRINETALSNISQREFKNRVLTTVSNQHPDLINYYTWCTTYAANLVAAEHEASLRKQYSIIKHQDQSHVLTKYNVHKVNETTCTCKFNVQMSLPCRHLFYVRRSEQLAAFEIALVSPRFLKSFSASTLASTSYEDKGTQPQPKIVVRNITKKNTRHEKFKKAVILTHKIAEAVSELSEKDFIPAMKNLEIILECLQNKEAMNITSMKNTNMTDRIRNEHSYYSAESTNPSNDVISSIEVFPSIENGPSTENSPSTDGYTPATILSRGLCQVEELTCENPIEEVTVIATAEEATSSVPEIKNISNIKVRKIKCRGRPSQKKVAASSISKRKKQSANNERQPIRVDAFENKPFLQKQMLMLSWFVSSDVVPKAVCGLVIEEDQVECIPDKIPDGCVDSKVCLEDIKRFFSDDAWLTVENTVQTKKNQKTYSCGFCQEILLNDCNSIACDSCLSWFHWKCQRITEVPKKKCNWFCEICKQSASVAV